MWYCVESRTSRSRRPMYRSASAPCVHSVTSWHAIASVAQLSASVRHSSCASVCRVSFKKTLHRGKSITNCRQTPSQHVSHVSLS